MKKLIRVFGCLLAVVIPAHASDMTQMPSDGASALANNISIRTESYPRPPYSGATYYIYEKNNRPICTKLEVCNKFRNCQIEYRKGRYQEQEDAGEPYARTDKVVIPSKRLNRHACLTKFNLK